MAARYACVELQRDDCETLSVALNFSSTTQSSFVVDRKAPVLIAGLPGKARDGRALVVGVRGDQEIAYPQQTFRPWNASSPVLLTVASPDLPICENCQ
jgi:hypothetical protein